MNYLPTNPPRSPRFPAHLMSLSLGLIGQLSYAACSPIQPGVAEPAEPFHSLHQPDRPEITLLPALGNPMPLPASSPPIALPPEMAAATNPSTVVADSDPITAPTERIDRRDPAPLASSTSPPSIPNSQPEAAQPDRQTLFEQVFGKPTPDSTKSVIVPWSINQIPQGEMGISIAGAADQISWNATSFLTILGQTLTPQLQAQLHELMAQGPLSPTGLKTLNIETQFNPQSLTLNIQLSPDQLRTNVVAIRDSNSQQDTEPTVTPARISGYVNMRGNLGWDWISERGDTGRKPLALSWDGVVNVEGWAVEGRADFAETGVPRWRRGDLRVVRDWPQIALRATAGEISTPTTGYQRSQSILGIAASRQFAIQPDRITRPIGNYEFFLESPSKVEIYINGNKDRIFNLPAGTQDLRDFSLSAGINDIELLITDPVGRVQRLQFMASTASQLLAPGLQQYAYSIGFPIAKAGEQRLYQWQEPLLSASHRWGISDTLTSGTYLQASLDQQLLGWDGVWATTLGNLDWDMALSRDPDVGIGYGGKLTYNYRRAGDSHQRDLTIGLDYRSVGFLSVGETEAKNDRALEARFTYSQTLFETLRANLGIRYQWGRGDRGNAYRLNLGLSRPMGLGRNLGITLSHEQRDDGSSDSQAKLNFSMAFSPRRGHNIRLTTDADLAGFAKQDISWNHSPQAAFNSIRTTAKVSYRPTDWDLDQRLAWDGHRAQVELRNSIEGNTARENKRKQNEGANPTDFWLAPKSIESQLTFGTAIAFADGHWGLSRPISGSFALLAPHPNLKGIDIEVNPSRAGASARINQWGAAVLPGLSDYRINVVNLDAPNLPLGYSLGRSTHRLRPGYRQGSLVTVGQDATVFLRGTLQTAKGEPMALVTGEVISLADRSWKPIILFTNQRGKFALEGFKPGRYALQLTLGDRLEFTIPETAKGIYTLDALKMPSNVPSTTENVGSPPD